MSDQGHHTHGHHQQEGHSYEAANKAAYGRSKAIEMADPLQFWSSNQCADAILKCFDFKKGQTTVLDFACGSGIIANRLFEHAKKVVGVDLSQDMVDTFNEQVEKDGLDRTALYAVQKEALRDEDDELGGEKFDVVTCSQAFHHIPDLQALTKALVRRLKPNGKLIVVDIDAACDFKHVTAANEKMADVVAHKHGFTHDELRQLFEGAGALSNVTVDPAHSETFGEMRARGGKHNMAARSPFSDDSVMKWVVAAGTRLQ